MTGTRREDYREEIERLEAEIERLRTELAEFTELKEYATSLGQETYLELHARNERLLTALRRISSLEEKNVPKYAQQIAREALTAA